MIPGDDKLFALLAESTNGHNSANYLFLDHHQEKTRIYIVFEVEAKKPVTSATVEIDGKPITNLTLVDTYSTLTIEDSETLVQTSGGKYLWQVAYFEHDDLQEGSHICISATTKAGGFNIEHIDHVLQVKYSLTVTKELSMVNGSPVQSGQKVAVGDTLTWVINVENHGDIDLVSITVKDQLPGAVLDITDSFDLAAGEAKQIFACTGPWSR